MACLQRRVFYLFLHLSVRSHILEFLTAEHFGSLYQKISGKVDTVSVNLKILILCVKEVYYTVNATHEDVAKKLLQFNVILNLIQLCYSQDILISSQTGVAPRIKAWECSSWRTEKWLQVWEKTGQPWLNSLSILSFNIIGYQSLSSTYVNEFTGCCQISTALGRCTWPCDLACRVFLCFLLLPHRFDRCAHPLPQFALIVYNSHVLHTKMAFFFLALPLSVYKIPLHKGIAPCYISLALRSPHKIPSPQVMLMASITNKKQRHIVCFVPLGALHRYEMDCAWFDGRA